jgi:uncharacterized membrane protein YvbJ
MVVLSVIILIVLIIVLIDIERLFSNMNEQTNKTVQFMHELDAKLNDLGRSADSLQHRHENN